MTNRQNRIRTALITVLTPELLEVEDESHLHAGHAGASPTGETHYSIKVWSKSFEGMNRVEIHRKINETLQSEFDSGLHALSIRIVKPNLDN
ncbi:BolA family protein [Hirschia baltica]|uniref:BolA family protein n=1 Tax=Hirschia baltica (strain ATCC 49814 / DSM 5838 / IFAM 1418) TaxID=582402 RepID=C6XPJ4_HIRBI|nr:BolA family protein [Hirschia baltica]ACT58480.1 BolA family protein [Hirschia baltica ATCC 49814]